MSIKLGNTTASLYLCSTPVAAYLGAEQVYSAVQAATLYFNGAVDDDWTEVGNWWLDDEHTEPAGRLPTSADSVVATASITASGQTVVNFTMSAGGLVGNLNVTGMATFNGDSINDATLNGNATFNGSLYNGGTVTGNATFNGSSYNNGGTVTGNATFNGSSYNDGTVGGDATFNDGSANYGFVTGTATFTGSACNFEGTAGTFVPDPPPGCF
jgi:hypothetical protein